MRNKFIYKLTYHLQELSRINQIYSAKVIIKFLFGIEHINHITDDNTKTISKYFRSNKGMILSLVAAKQIY